ncbi:MAG: hypothetical protein IV097_15030 [Burkholderiaceae bacterium]|nr:hypothetical protein [Burkholderiaceae bacterium]
MSATPSEPSPLKQDLVARLETMQAGLSGFPVASLLEIYTSSLDGAASGAPRERAFSLVDTCLSSWIATLSRSIEAQASLKGRTAEADRQRQVVALDALVRVRFMLLSEQNRSQPN